MPPQGGCRGQPRSTPTRPREQSAGCSKDRSIGWPVSDTCAQLPLENTHLVAEHHDLDVLVRFGPSARASEAEELAHPEIDEREDHGGLMPDDDKKCQLRAHDRVLVPFTLELMTEHDGLRDLRPLLPDWLWQPQRRARRRPLSVLIGV